ncbi:hypothetical protein CsatA_009312 [Cannabis sativa]
MRDCAHLTLEVVTPKKIIHLDPIRGRPISEEITQMIASAFRYIRDAHEYLGPWQGISQANCPRQPKSQVDRTIDGGDSR